MIIGLKLLHDKTSLNGLVDYTKALSGKWQQVPGNGSYVAHTGGLWSAGQKTDKPRYVVMECKDELSIRDTPPGVRCWRYVRYLHDATEEDLTPLVWCEPRQSICYVKHLKTILSKSNLIELAKLCPWMSLSVSKDWKEIVPPEVWYNLALIDPWALHKSVWCKLSEDDRVRSVALKAARNNAWTSDDMESARSALQLLTAQEVYNAL